MKKIVLISWFSLWIALVLTSSAQAYLDPGSGSMLLQLLLGGVAGAAVALRLYWRRLLHFLGLRKEAVLDSPAPPRPPDSETELRLGQRR